MSAPDTQIGLMYEMKLYTDGAGGICSAEQGFTFLWSSLPGRLSDSHTVVKVKDYIGRKGCWKMGYEYDKMVSTYHNIKTLTGIED